MPFMFDFFCSGTKYVFVGTWAIFIRFIILRLLELSGYLNDWLSELAYLRPNL